MHLPRQTKRSCNGVRQHFLSIAAVFFKYFLLISSAETFHILTNFHFPITFLVDSLHISVNKIENEIKVYIFMWAKYDKYV